MLVANLHVSANRPPTRWRRVKDIKEHVQGYQDRLAKLEGDYPWIANEKASFGRGDYDFEKHDMRK